MTTPLPSSSLAASALSVLQGRPIASRPAAIPATPPQPAGADRRAAAPKTVNAAAPGAGTQPLPRGSLIDIVA